MHITFLIGNGFDLACGLKTGYDDFYKWYLEQESENENISQFKKEIQKDIKHNESEARTWADLEIGLATHTKRFTSSGVHGFYLERLDDISEKLAQYLSIEQERIDFERIPSSEIKKFVNSLVHYYEELPPTEKDAIRSLATDNVAYNSINIFSYNFTTVLDWFVNSVQNMHPSEIISKLIGKKPINERMFVIKEFEHIHGRIGWWPVIGVDNEIYVSNKDMLKNHDVRTVLLKPDSIKSLGEKWLSIQEESIKLSKVVCIFGMSLGESDSNTWEKILAWLESNNSHHIIIFWYSKKSNNTISRVRRNQEIRRAQDALFQFSDYTQEKMDSFRPRVHVILNSKKVFNLDVVNAEDKALATTGG